MKNYQAYFKNYQKHKVPHTFGDFDADGIPLFSPKSLKLKGEPSYHPIVIAQYGLAHYNLWIEHGKIEQRDVFLKCAHWLLNNYTYYKEFDIAIYYYHFDLKNPPIKAPWFSGMAQGQILSLFVRAYDLTKDKEYINVGEKVVNSFINTIDNKGCGSHLDNHFFIQEIATNPKLYILNGALYAIIGLVEYREVSTIDSINFKAFIDGLENLLPRFDLGFWTKYSLGMRFNLADAYYQEVHAQQLIFLGEKLDNELLLNYGNKFQNQYKNNAKLIKYVHFLSLNINRAFRVVGLGRYLYKYKK